MAERKIRQLATGNVDKTPKGTGLPCDGARKSRMVLAAFVPESPAHRRKLQGLFDYAAKAGWNIENAGRIAPRLLDARMADFDAGRHETYGVLGIASRGSTRVRTSIRTSRAASSSSRATYAVAFR